MTLCDHCRRGLDGRSEPIHRRASALTDVEPYPVTLELCGGCAWEHDRHLADQANEADLRREERGEPAICGGFQAGEIR